RPEPREGGGPGPPGHLPPSGAGRGPDRQPALSRGAPPPGRGGLPARPGRDGRRLQGTGGGPAENRRLTRRLEERPMSESFSVPVQEPPPLVPPGPAGAPPPAPSPRPGERGSRGG